ncbi:MAG: hypothetical protein IJH67_03955 [Thermoguttaceae bacterium]|nr:hypothetical protein [Thermoguttaceae bacterium]
MFADEVRRRILSRKERIERKEVFGSSGKLASGVYAGQSVHGFNGLVH